MTLSVSVRIEPVSAQKYEAQRNHDLRISPPDYIALERSKMNSIPRMPPTLNKIHKINKILKQKAKFKASKMLQKAEKGSKKYEIAKKAVMAARQGYNELGNVAFIGIITFSIKAQIIINKLSYKDQDIRYMFAAYRVAEELGSKAMYLTAHRDECSPHAHFAITAVGVNGRKLDPKRGDCSRLQDVVAEIYADLGLRRGIYKAQRIRSGENRSKIIHETVSQLHARLPIDLANAQRNVSKARNKFNKIRIKIIEEQFKNDVNLKKMKYELAKIQYHIDELNSDKESILKIIEIKKNESQIIMNQLNEMKIRKEDLEKQNKSIEQLNKKNKIEMLKSDIKIPAYEAIVEYIKINNSDILDLEWKNFVIDLISDNDVSIKEINEVFEGSPLQNKISEACSEIEAKSILSLKPGL
ncbi:plasmid recombination protein [Desulfomicrobium sp. ZS1]|uniref:plasmid recombination protein n=1 Tax=Desulfomicrobium sp. ZS1 TaxID=2952228 RepID=UPI0020B38CA3|nr:plasmid recombination protein [Desulfomicrobium sp. ZS1]UTF51855.1 plasmid recombination protein [Desulfomicrobium sp. ZS1]